jgi:DNA (cytosine-5)-methyltransferase 1
MNHLDMCSGIGGWALAFRELGINTVAFCEIDKYPQQVLQKNFPNIPIFNDLKELTYEDIKERTGVDDIDLITCSYPCQPFSVAGMQKGEEDSRHLWPDTFRIVQECKPTWFVGENVGGHIKLGLDTVLEDLASIGYDTRTFVIPASSIGAWHQRKRIWIIGHREDVENSNSRGRCRQEGARQDNSKGVSREKQNSIINQASKGCTSREFTISESQNVCYSEHNGSLATKKSRKHQETARGTPQGQNKTEQSEGASRSRNYENVSDTESLRFGRRSGEECRTPKWQFLQEEQEGCEIWREAERCSTSFGEDVSNTSSEGSQRFNAKSSINESQLGHGISSFTFWSVL